MTLPSITRCFMPKSFALVSCCWLISCGVLLANVGTGTLNGDFKALTLSGARIVAIDQSSADSELSTSDDNGASFTTRKVTSENYEALAAVGSTVIAVGIDGQVLRSSDSGTSWSEATAPLLFGSLYSVAGRSNGSLANQWVAVGDDGLDGAVYRSVDDGLSWTAQTLSEVLIQDVVWTGSGWLLCGSDAFYDGVVYRSSDGQAWSASSVPVGSAALLSMASDGSGVVVAVGESGQVLRSTDDGLTFSAVAESLFSGDIYTVANVAEDAFYLGGDEKAVISLSGINASLVVPPAPQASPVLDIILVGNTALATGAFEAAARTVPLDLLLSTSGTLDYRLSVTESLNHRTYVLETSTDLTTGWTLLPSSAQVGNGSSIFFDVSAQGIKRFWRISEF